MQHTPIQYICKKNGNSIYIKRDDLIPYSFGGNKVRKAFLFFDEIDAGNYDCVVTYGSSHSNHCRVIANMAAARKMPCYIIGPEEVSDATYNSKLMKLFGAYICSVPIEYVNETIQNEIERLKMEGKKPYFIPGGGHGNIGTRAYVQCYNEIAEYQERHALIFDYIFLASGTGTTHAGLICGQIMQESNEKIVGISIARQNPRGRNVVIDSVKEYMPNVPDDIIQDKTVFIDEYIGEGYGKTNEDVEDTIKQLIINYGIPMDSTYVGKAYNGMVKYIEEKGIIDKNILFIHTGGTPLFFDDLR